ncbi:hypothetical protein [Terrabacter terrigena]|uniref:Uncharacterized protein n=1 Tax=Terrabacter terrigena TaxID=574718 RepID=A0ABW3MZH6_9MICO
MQSRDGGTRRSALLATGSVLALCLGAVLAVWAFGAGPARTQATAGDPPGSSAAAQRPAQATGSSTGQRPGRVSGKDAKDRDRIAASEDATAQQTAGRPGLPQGPSFVGDVGTYLVGRGIPPGTYESAGGHAGRTCHWFRLKGLTGRPADVVASGSTNGPARVTILRTDAFFQTRDCATWSRVAA